MCALHPLAGGAHPSVSQLTWTSLVLSREAESASASTRVVVPLPVGRLGRVVFPNRMRLARTSNADLPSVIYESSPKCSSFGFHRTDFAVVHISRSFVPLLPPPSDPSTSIEQSGEGERVRTPGADLPRAHEVGRNDLGWPRWATLVVHRCTMNLGGSSWGSIWVSWMANFSPEPLHHRRVAILRRLGSGGPAFR
jgi:hypothetical protein